MEYQEFAEMTDKRVTPQMYHDHFEPLYMVTKMDKGRFCLYAKYLVKVLCDDIEQDKPRRMGLWRDPQGGYEVLIYDGMSVRTGKREWIGTGVFTQWNNALEYVFPDESYVKSGKAELRRAEKKILRECGVLDNLA